MSNFIKTAMRSEGDSCFLNRMSYTISIVPFTNPDLV